MSNSPLRRSLPSGTVISSELQPGVRYRIERALGEGGTGIVFFAVRDAPDGVSPVVIKVMRPEIVASMGGTADKLVRKEVVALSRIGARVPPTPFVVQFIDTGSVHLQALAVTLPWIAIEYVYGGIEGTTLEARVLHSRDHTGFAFDRARSAHALRNVGAGLAAIHEVGVVHRDLTPGNVLCCGFGEAEIFKISDFGLARLENLETFGNVVLGTPAYAAPEQNFREQHDVGPYSDVFSLACVAYFVLTGEPYFDVVSVPHALVAVKAEARKSIRQGEALCPELRDDPAACHLIDGILARATSKEVGARPQHSQALVGALAQALQSAPEAARASSRRMQSVLSLRSPVAVRGWQWTVRSPSRADIALHAVAWDGDGHCLATSTGGVLFWSGNVWQTAAEISQALAGRIRCVSRVRAGTWVLGGDDAAVVYANGGVREVLPCPGASFQHASGHLEDQLATVSDRNQGHPELRIFAQGTWGAPLELTDFRVVSSMARLGPATWLLAGRRHDGAGGLALSRPLEQSLTWLEVPPTRALLSSASQTDRELGLAAGTHGVVVRVDPAGAIAHVLDGHPNVSACALDILDREWAGGAGRLWVKEPGSASPWRTVWEDGVFSAPFVSLMADVGVILAITADGGVLEGRAPWSVVGAAA